MTKKSSSSKQWLYRRSKDLFANQAKIAGYRSRAAYKLLEIIDHYHIINKNDVVLDLGAAPGSWSQVVTKHTNNTIIASDILAMKPITGVKFLQGDFTKQETYHRIINLLDNKVNAVLSDMAPNMSGHNTIDLPKAIYLAELALDMAIKILSNNGVLLVKSFHGNGFDNFVGKCKNHFKTVIINKPKSSKPTSKEVYIIAKYLKLR